ncbi:MAG: hypothetical protein ACRERC_16230 [Candidatus Binatia bacterium]
MKHLALGALLALAAAAAAHEISPDEAMARIGDPAVRAAFDVTAVERKADLPRLLVVRVGPGWAAVYPERRRDAAETWYHLWRDAVPGGIVAIVDRDEQSLVNFDAAGLATMHDPAPRPTAPD